ncbi:MAG: hypothetical protein QM763_25290 [Agriterribacter sp.]
MIFYFLRFAIVVLITGSLLISCKKNNNNSGDAAISRPVTLSATDHPTIAVSTSDPEGGEGKLMDKDAASGWRSGQSITADAEQWIAWQLNEDSVNYIKLFPLYNSGVCSGFPVNFTVYYKNGNDWKISQTFTDFLQPLLGPVILPLKEKIFTSGIRLLATKLGVDTDKKFSLQFSELLCGYDNGFDKWQFVENDKSPGSFKVNNVGSDEFDPAQLDNWNYDYRNPLLVATSGGIGNIYAPYVADNGDNWNIYFGGWDGTTDGFDKISLTITEDNFQTFGGHQLMMSNGEMIHINNETVLKKTDHEWIMYYTTYGGDPAYNKPGYATSSDGIHWTPGEGSFDYLLEMTGYPDWQQADVNGSNVIVYENGIYHLFFNDFNHQITQQQPMQVYHATSTDGIHFTYGGAVLNEIKVAQDVRKFTYNNTPYYLMLMHLNSGFLNYSIGSDLSSFSASTLLTENENENDRYITSGGWIAKNNRLYGVLYGASAVSTLDRNAVYAKWLQKKVVFKADDTNDIISQSKAYGPDNQVIEISKQVITGKFSVYASDGKTILYNSPSVTVCAGDVWNYAGN